MTDQLPAPQLTRVYRLEAALGDPLDVGVVSQGHRRIVPLTGGGFAGPELNGHLLAGASADWQIVLPDGTALGDIRYTLKTDDGALLSTSNHEACATEAPRSSDGSPAAKTSTRASTSSAPPPRSRLPRPSSTGSTKVSSSASPAAGRAA